MKLFRLVIPILAGLAMAVGTLTALARGKAAPASPPAPIAMETDLIPGSGGETLNGAENMHPDANGRLWISQDSESAAYVRVFDPATHAYTDYTGLASPNDAQLGPDGNVWWALDTPTAGLARMDLASRTVTTWSAPAKGGGSLAFDSNNNVWALDCCGPSIVSFDPIHHTLCTMPLPNGDAGAFFMTEHNGAFWMGLGDEITPGLARITPTTPITIDYTFWPLNDAGYFATPAGVAFAPNGDIWFSDEVSDTIGRLETGANRATLFNPPGRYTAQNVDYFLGKVWFTGQTDISGTIGYLDPATAISSTALVVTPTTAVLTTTVCADAGAGLTFTAAIRTGVSVFNPMALTTTVDIQGISYGTPISSQPAALVRFGSNLWLTDQGRNKLVEFVISPTIFYLPLMKR